MLMDDIVYDVTEKKLARLKPLVDSKQLQIKEACMILGISPHLYHKFSREYEKSLKRAEEQEKEK